MKRRSWILEWCLRLGGGGGGTMLWSWETAKKCGV